MNCRFSQSKNLVHALRQVAPAGTRCADKPIGAALVLQQDAGWALLDMIFVAPAWQRHGLAGALAAAALTGLHGLGGFRRLVSRYHLGNEPSRAWHQRFGFVNEPDLRLARLHYHAVIHELHRLREMGELTPRRLRQLRRERAGREREVKRFEALIEQGRAEEADPWRKWRRDLLSGTTRAGRTVEANAKLSAPEHRRGRAPGNKLSATKLALEQPRQGADSDHAVDRHSR